MPKNIKILSTKAYWLQTINMFIAYKIVVFYYVYLRIY